MGAFIVYLIKSSICMLFFVLINKVLLERETFHIFNRVAWLAILVISLLLPFFEWGSLYAVELAQSLEQTVTVEGLQILGALEGADYFGLIVSSLIACFLVFTFFFVINLLISYCKLFSILASPKVESIAACSLLEECKKIIGYDGRLKLILCEEDIAPFSWMNYIVISRADLENSGREILIHELSHIKSKHSLDLIFIDLISIFQWFNPALWLAKRAIMQVHEYSADTSVIESGVDAKQYQLLLIKKAVGQRFYSMANSFNHSKLKKRITMMLQKKSSKWALAKCLYALPLALFAVAAFANPKISNHLNEISSVEVTQNFEISEYFSEEMTTISHDATDATKEVNKAAAPKKEEVVVLQSVKEVQKTDEDDIFQMVEQAPVFPEGNVSAWIAKRMKYPVEAQKAGVEGRVYLQFVIEKDGSVSNIKVARGVDKILDAEAIRVIKLMPKWTPGKQKGKAVRCSFSMPINFALSKSETPKKEDVLGIQSIKEVQETDEDDIFQVVQEQPVFPEGKVSEWIAKHVKYPVEAQKAGAEGRVYAQFVIEKNGSISNVKIVRGVDKFLDAETVRVIKLMPKWTPGKQRGKVVRCSFSMPVNFQLSSPPPPPPPTQK